MAIRKHHKSCHPWFLCMEVYLPFSTVCFHYLPDRVNKLAKRNRETEICLPHGVRKCWKRSEFSWSSLNKRFKILNRFDLKWYSNSTGWKWFDPLNWTINFLCINTREGGFYTDTKAINLIQCDYLIGWNKSMIQSD